ncbi:septation protein A [Denitratisoma oestradiolicum]|uniref:Inner membrane-spanning protein YciB n=1 Tax=Denitratisoma oestradiolicum TaxID=311182 RepID=A0A6S6XWL8_9PROT|nr:septation protein A [Denitratisoma oestradiolicum]TWO81303.1 septation protein A [Denitratisoma oestradiolicum]CAB1368487.1 putative intracellular septation protein involved in cell division [Denitratisoma oestradiolicum]
MKFLFDLFPIILFFIAFKLAGVFTATAVAIAATGLQVAWVWWRHGKVDTMLWVSLALVTVFGGATLLLHDEIFIKWKPTVLYWLFATTLAASALLFRRNLIRTMLGEQITLPDKIWARLNGAWVIFFLTMGGLNLIIAFSFSTDIWVNFKLFGGMGLMLVFVIAQSLFLGKYVESENEEKP